MLRDGDWDGGNGSDNDLRSAHRSGGIPSYSYDNVGFRLASRP